MAIRYSHNADISVEQAIILYKASSLGERRPVDRPDIFEGMINNADVTVTAWDGDKLVGIARSLSDHSYVAYLADLVVHEDYQKQGIGKELIEATRQQLGPECMLVLLAAPKAAEYYPRLGFEHNPRAWTLTANKKLK